MKYLSLILISFLLCGCRTFSNTELKLYKRDILVNGYAVGFDDGYKLGFKIGECQGHIDEIFYRLQKIK
jgi:hypothetical protein